MMPLPVTSHQSPVTGSGRAFTFVELVIASMMVAVLLVGLGVHLRGGLSVWHRTTATGDRLQQWYVAGERLRRDTADAIIYDSRDPAAQPSSPYGTAEGRLPLPEWTSASLRFYTIAASSRRAPATVHVVSYACETVDDVTGLWRTAESLEAARLRSGQGPPPARTLVLPGCESLAVRYAYLVPDTSGQPVMEWRSSWTEGLQLPHLFEVTFHTADQDLRQVCLIPHGSFGAP